ncbi:MAG: hypothetical protein KIT19_10770 [Phycisphaeraceae bacterium]|nr:hypothetical protein [Phycisphaeraceae bacterium]
MADGPAPLSVFLDRVLSVESATSRLYRNFKRLEDLAESKQFPEALQTAYWSPIDHRLNPEEVASHLDEIAELEESQNAPWGRPMAAVIRAVIGFRLEIDVARDGLYEVACFFEAPATPASELWRVRVDGSLRKLRACIMVGQPRDAAPSCLPWVGQGVLKRLEEHIVPISELRELVKSMIFSGAAALSVPPVQVVAPRTARDRVELAYEVASALIRHLHTLAYHSRQYDSALDKADEWRNLAPTFAAAFIARHDLRKVLTDEVRSTVGAVYGPGTDPIKLGRLPAMPSLLEAVSDGLGIVLRNTIYLDQRDPIESFGPERWLDAFELLISAWRRLPAETARTAIGVYRLTPIDFNDLTVRLERERRAAVDLVERSERDQQESSHVRNKKPRVKKDRGEVKARLLLKEEEGGVFPGYTSLESELGCARSTIHAAIHESPRLLAWMEKSQRPSVPRVESLSEVVSDRTSDERAEDPREYLPDEDIDAEMNRLIQEANPSERAGLNGLDREQRRNLVSATLDQIKDGEASPLQTDQPGKRRLGPKIHRRL